MSLDFELAFRMMNLDRRVARLETLEGGGGGGGSGDLFLIETVNLTAPGIIEISGIPATAKHLFYSGFVLGRGQNCAIIMNGSAHANDESNMSSFFCSGAPSTATYYGNMVPLGMADSLGVGAPDDSFAALWGWIPNIQDPSTKTGATGWAGTFARDDAIIHNMNSYRGGGNWDSAAAITQINLFHTGVGGQTFEIGSRFSLYGMTE